LEKENDHFEKKVLAAEKEGKVLRFIAKLENGKASISLESVDKQHPFYSLSGSDNIISYTTERYKERPLVVKGPGAGAEVTAAGVFADIINISNY
jgi:aspartokinase/homoserine dehydrogenase 1